MFGVRGLIVREEELNEQDDGQKGDRHEVEKTKGIGLRYFDTFVQVGLVD